MFKLLKTLQPGEIRTHAARHSLSFSENKNLAKIVRKLGQRNGLIKHPDCKKGDWIFLALYVGRVTR
jgi:hypothetical protein